MENENDATFCKKCGKQFPAASKIPAIDEIFDSLGINMSPAMKKALVAILLNFLIIWGLGYWYLGYKKVFDKYDWYMLMVAQIVIGLISSFVPFLGIIYFAAGAALAYDLYEKASGKQGFVPAK